MKRFLLIVIVLVFCTRIVVAQKRIGAYPLAQGYSIDSIVKNIESIYDFNMPLLFEHFRDTIYIDVEGKVKKYFDSVRDSCDIGAIEEYYDEMMLEASRKDYGEEEAIKYATTYLMCGLKDYAHDAYLSLATAYASLKDKDNLRYVLHCFEKSEINKDGEYDEIISQMRSQMNAVLNPRNIVSYSQGFWVSNLHAVRKKNKYFPYSIIEIRSLTDDGVFALNIPSFDNTSILPQGGFNTFRMAQIVEAKSSTSHSLGSIGIKFNSQKFQQGINTSSGFEATRRFQSEMQGTIAASKWSTGQKIGATVATTAVAGVMNIAMLAMAQSYHTIATMTLNLSPVSNDVMKGDMYYIYHTASTANFDVQPKPTYDGSVSFIRWLPEDSVYFVNSKGKICSVTAPENLDLTEYNRIQKWWKNVQTWTTVGAVIGGAGMMAGGISLIVKTNTKGGIIGGTFILITGEIAALIPSILIWQRYPTKKYSTLNQAQLQKLQKKHQAELSLSPTVNPIDASAGVSVNIKY